jgi:hypothetical protein
MADKQKTGWSAKAAFTNNEMEKLQSISSLFAPPKAQAKPVVNQQIELLHEKKEEDRLLGLIGRAKAEITAIDAITQEN